jgi:hypothetical protein
MLPSTADRVLVNTAESVNARFRQETEETVARCAAAGPEAIARRLAELDHEWDVERYVETLAPTFTLVGITLGLTVSRKFFVLPFAVQGFFLQHALHSTAAESMTVMRRVRAW